jgi:hypothetical protein
MAMHLVETIVSETTVRLRYADHVDPAKATEWLDFQVPTADLKSPDQHNPLGDIESRYLAEVRLVALRHVRDIIGAETQRLSGLVGRIA